LGFIEINSIRMRGDGKWERNCKLCGRISIHKSKESCIICDRNCIGCNICSRSKKSLKRNCPMCHKELFYKNQGAHNLAQNRNSKCKECTKLCEDMPYKKSMFKKWVKNNLKRLDYVKKWKEGNKDRINFTNNKRAKHRKKTDVIFKLKCSLRTKLSTFLKKNHFKKTQRTMDVLGCSVDDLKLKLEYKFKPGMNWENYGKFGWHIDHIRPLSLAKTEQEIEKLFHHTNLQPLWWDENIKKGNKIQ
jgi:hypothetical protein